MGCLLKLAVVFLMLSVIIGYTLHYITQPPPLPKLNLQYWGPGKEKPDDKTVKPFKISFPEADLQYLKDKLVKTRALTPPLEEVGFEYGVNTAYFNKFVEFWKTKYNWTEREAFLNQYPQFTTQIGGLNIHFLRVKPDAGIVKGKQVLPLLMLHGWPGSVREFYDIIPMLTSPRQDEDFIFELIIPSLPGYGFSQASSKPGLHPAHMAVIFNELMTRLGFSKYYIQGGDWGSLIGQIQSILYPQRVLGYHSNCCMVMTNKGNLYTALFYMFPKIFLEESMQESFTSQFSDFFYEMGYNHLQSTKPDTIGVALTDSPVGLAAYIIEKFSTWTNRNWRSLPDGGLEKLDKIEIIDNVMIYWLTKSITTSMRLYKELYGNSMELFKLGIVQNPTKVPTACALFKYELLTTPHPILATAHDNLLLATTMPTGGHFAALEQPKLLSEDIWKFLKIIRNKK